MGGYGSGRGPGRSTTEDYPRLDVRQLQRDGYLIPDRESSLYWARNGKRFASIRIRALEEGLVLTYGHRSTGIEQWTHEEYPVQIERTRCHYGGQRVWFRCPVRRCQRRVAILYGAGIFACRECHFLVYESQGEAAHYRALHRAQEIRVKLGGSASMDEPFPPRPKGMHRLTYLRFLDQFENAELRAIPAWIL